MEVRQAPSTPEARAPQARPQPKPEAKPFGTDLARIRVSTDRRVITAQSASDRRELKPAEDAAYSDILREQRQQIEARTESDPVTADARSRGWSPEVQKQAASDSGDRNGAKVWSQIGEKVDAARRRHAVEVWGKFAEESPQTAAKFAKENPDVKTAVEAHRAIRLREANQFIQNRINALIQVDRTYIDAVNAGKSVDKSKIIQDITPRLRARAYDDLVEANPDAARFLAESNADPSVRTAYERYLTRQEAAKVETANQAAQTAAQSGPEAGLKVIANSEPEPVWDGLVDTDTMEWRRFGIEFSKTRPNQAAQGGTEAAPPAPPTVAEGPSAADTDPEAAFRTTVGEYNKRIQAIDSGDMSPVTDPLTGETILAQTAAQVRAELVRRLGTYRQEQAARRAAASRASEQAPTQIPTAEATAPRTPETAKLPAKTRFAQAAMEAGRLNSEVAIARANGRPAAEIQTLEAKAQEATAKLDPLLAEVVTDEMVRNLSSEQDPKKRRKTAQDLVRNERNPQKRQSLLDAFMAAGILAATVIGGTSELRNAA